MARNARGFTLIEAMTTLLVGAALLAIVAPTLAGLRSRTQATAALHEITAALAVARMEAVRQGRTVMVCPTRDGETCGDTTDWSSGWLVLGARHPRGTNADNADADYRVLRRFSALPGSLGLHGTSGRRVLRFRPTGWSPGSNATLRLCAEGRLLARVVLNNGGRARTARASPGTRCQ